MTVDTDSVKNKYFCEAFGELAYIEQLLLGVNVENPSMTALSEILRAFQKLKVGSVICHYRDITELAFIAEYLLDKVIGNKLMLTSEYVVDTFLQVHGVLNMLLYSYQVGIPANQNRVVEARKMLNDAMNQGVR